MKAKHLWALAGMSCALGVSGTASAHYTGLSVELYTTVNVGGGDKDVYRVYANFTNENDYLTAIAGSPTLGAMTIMSINAAGTGPGGNFFNPGGGGSNLPPYEPDGTLEWGTFVDIGLTLGNQAVDSGTDYTFLSPGFPNFINGNLLTTDNAGMVSGGPREQGRAGFAGDGDLELRVFCMQLTVASGDTVAGTVVVGGVNSDSSPGPFLTMGDQVFAANVVPAPGSLALLGIIGLLGTRRRRTSAEPGQAEG